VSIVTRVADSFQLSVLALGVSFLYLFVRANWTGPEVELPHSIPHLHLFGTSPDHTQKTLVEFERRARQGLRLSGEEIAPSTQHCYLLALARVLLVDCCDTGAGAPLWSALWWSSRCAMVHQSLLSHNVEGLRDLGLRGYTRTLEMLCGLTPALPVTSSLDEATPPPSSSSSSSAAAAAPAAVASASSPLLTLHEVGEVSRQRLAVRALVESAAVHNTFWQHEQVDHSCLSCAHISGIVETDVAFVVGRPVWHLCVDAVRERCEPSHATHRPQDAADW